MLVGGCKPLELELELLTGFSSVNILHMIRWVGLTLSPFNLHWLYNKYIIIKNNESLKTSTHPIRRRDSWSLTVCVILHGNKCSRLSSLTFAFRTLVSFGAHCVTEQHPGAQANGVAGFCKLLPSIVTCRAAPLPSNNPSAVVHDGMWSKGKLRAAEFSWMAWFCMLIYNWFSVYSTRYTPVKVPST